MRAPKNSKFVLVILLVGVLCFSGGVFYLRAQASHNTNSLNVQIQPSLADMQQGQTNTLTVYGLNGTAPYRYLWSYAVGNNVTEMDRNPFAVFSTSNPAYFNLGLTIGYIEFKCVVTDSQGNSGIATRTITDTAASIFTISSGVYPGAPTYTIYSQTIGGTTTYYAKDSNGAVDFTSTNAATVIQDAVSSNTVIDILAGTYTITRTIELSNVIDTTIIGQGRATELNMPSQNNGFLIDLNSSQDCNIEYLYLYGSGLGTGIGSLIRLYGSAYDYIGNIIAQNSAGDGILIDYSSKYITVENSLLTSNGASGIYEYTSCTHNNFINDVCTYNTENGIAISTSCGYDIIKDCNLNGNVRSGIIIYSYTSYETVSDCQAIFNGMQGYLIDDNCDWNTISNCKAIDNGQTGSSSDGIAIWDDAGQGYCVQNTISNCYATNIHGSQHFGINLYSTSQSNIIADCTSTNATVACISDTGTGNYIHFCWNGTSWISTSAKL